MNDNQDLILAMQLEDNQEALEALHEQLESEDEN